jgi:hypothetical protein
MAIIISGFAGIGKSTLAAKNPRILDLESSKYKWLTEGFETLNSEERKGLTARHMNPEWPENYLKEILLNQHNKDIDFIFISPSEEALNELEIAGIDFIIAHPSLEAKNEMLQRYRDRNNSEEFIHKMDTMYEKILKALSKRKQRKFILGPGEYLTDVISKLLLEMFPTSKEEKENGRFPERT